MNGFKHTGRGPKYFSGKIPVKCYAAGGLTDRDILEAPGFQDFKKGGKVTKKALKEQERMKALSNAGKLLRKARGGMISDKPRPYDEYGGVKHPMSVKTAMSHKRGGLAFARTPKIGK